MCQEESAGLGRGGGQRRAGEPWELDCVRCVRATRKPGKISNQVPLGSDLHFLNHISHS